MTRMYIQPSWIDAASGHSEWSGGNGQYYGDRSADIATFDRNGRARVEAFSDDAIETRKAVRKTSIPLRQRILPQEGRLNTVDTQIEELNQEYNSNRISYDEYAQLKTILQRKRDRAWELYVKAGGIVQNINESEQFGVEYATQNSVTEVVCGDACGVAWVDELSPKNTFKKMLQNTCKAFKLVVHYKHKMSNYLQTLKDL